MPQRLDYQAMALEKLKEAKILLRNGKIDTAHYIAGYVLEFSLKAAVCKHLDIDDFFDKKTYVSDNRLYSGYLTHVYKDLIVLAGLYKKLEDHKVNQPIFGANWFHIESSKMKWSEQCRYMVRTGPDVLTYIDVKQYIKALEDKPGGFLRWIKSYW